MGFCQKCGAPIEDDEKFCPVCGNPVEEVPANDPQQPVYDNQTPRTSSFDQKSSTYNSYDTMSQAEAPNFSAGLDVEAVSKSSMTLGIIGLVFGYLHMFLVCIILCAIALSKANKVKQYLHTDTLSGNAKAGQIMGKIGVIAGSVMMALQVIAFVFFVALAILAVPYMY